MSAENPLPACPRTVYIAEGETWHRYHDDRDCPRLVMAGNSLRRRNQV